MKDAALCVSVTFCHKSTFEFGLMEIGDKNHVFFSTGVKTQVCEKHSVRELREYEVGGVKVGGGGKWS